MTTRDTILKLLLEPRFKYKGMPVSMLGIPALFPYKKQSIANTLTKLSKDGYVIRKNDSLYIEPKGRDYLKTKRRIESLRIFEPNTTSSKLKNLIVLFDIPEERKTEREWFRSHLIRFGYIMIQKSVWIGPSPLL